MCVLSHSVMSDSLRPHGLQPARLLCPWGTPGKNTRVGCCFLFQGCISFKYTCIPSLLSLPPTHPSRSSHSTKLSSLCYTEASYQPSILHMVLDICQLLSQFVPPSPSAAVCTSLFSMLFLPCKIGSSVPFFLNSICMC